MGRKGSSFEREICVRLSKWWSGGTRDDIFWRTSGSGARASSRARSGKCTTGQGGDICAIDPIGAPLTQLLAIELKRGHNKFDIGSLLDVPRLSRQQKFEEWLQQAIESCKNSNSETWALIVKRDQRDEVVFFPGSFAILYDVGFEARPWLRFDVRVRFAKGNGKNRKLTGEECRVMLHGMKLDHFLKLLTPAKVSEMLERA